MSSLASLHPQQSKTYITLVNIILPFFICKKNRRKMSFQIERQNGNFLLPPLLSLRFHLFFFFFFFFFTNYMHLLYLF